MSIKHNSLVECYKGQGRVLEIYLTRTCTSIKLDRLLYKIELIVDRKGYAPLKCQRIIDISSYSVKEILSHNIPKIRWWNRKKGNR